MLNLMVETSILSLDTALFFSLNTRRAENYKYLMLHIHNIMLEKINKKFEITNNELGRTNKKLSLTNIEKEVKK